MIKQEFVRLIRCYGAKRDAWPETLRKELDAYIRLHPEYSKNVLEEESLLDDYLDCLTVNERSKTLYQRIQSQAQTVLKTTEKKPNNGYKKLQIKTAYRPILASAFILIMGFGLGLNYESFSTANRWEVLYYQTIYDLPDLVDDV